MFNVYQHWDPLKTCLVGCAYPPEFYTFIKDAKTRSMFENMSQETEDDYQGLIRLLEKFNVKVMRPELPEDLDSLCIGDKWVPPPTAPRDYFIMIQDKLWVPTIPNAHHARGVFERQNVGVAEPELVQRWQQFQIMDQQHLDAKLSFYHHVFDHVRAQGNEIA